MAIAVGDRFGKLVTLAMGERNASRDRFWLVRCDCGREKLVLANNLKRGLSKSCGCNNGLSTLKHGCSYHPLFPRWSGMLARCNDPRHVGYKNYGGRGISVCPEWTASFQAFAEWAEASGFAEGLTIDRIDNDGNYTPSNCRWATRAQQQRNRRKPSVETSGGKMLANSAPKRCRMR